MFLAISKSAESSALSARTIVSIHQRFKEASVYIAGGRTPGNKFSLSHERIADPTILGGWSATRKLL
jgi:hypothetical protein